MIGSKMWSCREREIFTNEQEVTARFKLVAPEMELAAADGSDWNHNNNNNQICLTRHDKQRRKDDTLTTTSGHTSAHTMLGDAGCTTCISVVSGLSSQNFLSSSHLRQIYLQLMTALHSV